MRRRLPAVLALLAVLSAAGCTSTIEGSATPANGGAAVAGGPLTQLRDDVDLGIDPLSGARLIGAQADASDAPVALVDGEDDVISVVRGTGPGQPVPIEEFGYAGQVDGMTLTEDGTLVTVGYAGDDSEPSVVRIGADDAVSVLTMSGPGADDDGIFYVLDTVAFSADGTRAVLARVFEEYTPATTVQTGEIEVRMVDTTTGAVTAPVRARVADPAARDLDAARLTIQDLAVTPDGGVVLAVDVPAADGSVTADLVTFGAGLTPGAVVAVQGGLSGTDPRAVEVDDTGRAYTTVSTEDSVRLFGLDAGATAATQLADVEGANYLSGMAVDRAGRFAYLTGLIDFDIGEKVTAVDLASGDVAGETALCESGFLDAPVLSPTGTALVVSGDCRDDDEDGQTRLYVLSA